MSSAEILATIRQMPPSERIALVEMVLHMTREDLAMAHAPSQEDQEMRAAATALREDYTIDTQFTSFTALDGVDFYAEG